MLEENSVSSMYGWESEKFRRRSNLNSSHINLHCIIFIEVLGPEGDDGRREKEKLTERRRNCKEFLQSPWETELL
jgi:hypothetical protein